MGSKPEVRAGHVDAYRVWVRPAFEVVQSNATSEGRTWRRLDPVLFSAVKRIDR